jgi:hypothetical protein
VEKLQKYLDVAIDASLPVPEDGQHKMITCASKAGCTAPLGPHPSNFREAHKYNHHMGDDPLILQCKPEVELNEDGSAATRHTYSADAVADRVLERWWNQSRPGVVMPTTPEEISALKWGGKHNDLPAHIDLLNCVLTRRTCWHKAAHMKTCSKSIKAQRTKICRARLPGDIMDASTIEILHPGCSHVRAKLAK